MTIQTDIHNAVLRITLNRPEALNAFDIPDLQKLAGILTDAKSNPEVRAVTITGTGRAFSAGADIKAMEQMSEEDFARAASLYQELARISQDLDKPMIAAINGFALGGGLEIALMCDLRIAGKAAKLGLPDAYMGFSPTGGLTWLLTRMVGLSVAMDMALTTDMLDAGESLRVGLVSRVVEDGDLLPTAQELAERMASFPKTGLRNIKRSFLAAADADFSTVLTLEEAYDSDCFRSEETQAALKAFIDSRKRK
ncbi:enoyl-CoA hydratase/isomerase family protein [Kiloniella sp. b19]|uniref:enoyl-CoA hydratase/isomerase family protein n=1 Tax=Kiloniella sp. GXU_MW_B19 TaxID=3141326 RepID=UPI0031D5D9CD